MIVAVFAEKDSPLIGLRNLVMPIRASNIHYNDLLHVVILGDAEYLKSKTYKDIYIGWLLIYFRTLSILTFCQLQRNGNYFETCLRLVFSMDHL